MANRAADWLKQAERDLEQAKASERAERYEWACFAAHQAAEKAVKASICGTPRRPGGTSWLDCSANYQIRSGYLHS